MQTFIRKGALAPLAVFAGLWSASVSGKFPPDYRWQTLRTEHFRVHHTPEQREFSLAFARRMEEAYAFLSRDLLWELRSPAEIVIQPDADVSNALASVFPYDRLVVQPTPFPEFGELSEFDDWIRTLAVHELTHLIANDMTRGLFEFGRGVMGSAAKMNPYQPQWLVEGLAVYFETRYGTAGRGRSAFVQGMLRAAASENLLDGSTGEDDSERRLLRVTLDRLNDGPPFWPGGTTPYLYGYLVNAWIHAKNARNGGEPGILGRIQLQNAGRVPFLIEGPLEDRLGGSYAGLWSEIVAFLRAKADADLALLRATPFSPLEVFTRVGRASSGPAYSPRRGKVYFIRDSYERGLGLSEWDLSTRRQKDRSPWRVALAGTRLRLSADERFLAYSRLEEFQDYSTLSDVYLYDLDDERDVQVTFGARAFDPDLSEDFAYDFARGRIARGAIAYVKEMPDLNQAIVLRDAGDPSVRTPSSVGAPPPAPAVPERETVARVGRGFERLSYPVFGRGRWKDWIVYLAKGNHGEQTLEAWNRASSEMRVLYRVDAGPRRETLTTPSWRSDGSIVFSSSDGGVYNVWGFPAAEVEGMLAHRPWMNPPPPPRLSEGVPPNRLTHVENGIFFPVDGDAPNRLFAMNLSARGTDLVRVDVGTPPIAPMPVLATLPDAIPVASVPTLSHPEPRPSSEATGDYSAFPALWPHYWAPTAMKVPDGWLYGVRTDGFDSIERHHYRLNAGGDTRASFPVAKAFYQYDGFFPSIQFEAEQSNSYFAAFRQSNRLDSASIRFLTPSNRSWFGVGANVNQQSFFDERSTTGGVDLSFSRSDFRAMPASIDREVGDRGYAVSADLNSYFFGEEKFSSISGRAEGRVPGPFRSHFLRGILDYAASNNRNFSSLYFTGGGTGTVTYDQDFLVRGYPSGTIYGRKIFTANLEYWLPLNSVFRGIGAWPAFYERTKIRLFADTGSAEYVLYDKRDFGQWPVGVGLDVMSDVDFFYRVPVTLSVGFDWGIRSDLGGEKQVVFGLTARGD